MRQKRLAKTKCNAELKPFNIKKIFCLHFLSSCLLGSLLESITKNIYCKTLCAIKPTFMAHFSLNSQIIGAIQSCQRSHWVNENLLLMGNDFATSKVSYRQLRAKCKITYNFKMILMNVDRNFPILIFTLLC